ncbi:YbbR-like domain-containing protein [Dokdonia sinensis]|uniref:YbbR-like domain-containing protein n=1 Tax=Dokdonia sinensis TaxID=2479847 RepID=A0A3M0FTK8_9FLAO|nr:YbbR-like domain-containing protein [Dokdonia sinensis]RMB56130.1 YbbR-like domain-containing protein [Dokdonia sinensis]
MTLKNGNWFDNSNVKGYLFFLLFTTVVAIFIKLANSYTTNKSFTIVLVGIPDNLAVDASDVNTVTVYYETIGFKLVSNSFRESIINIPFDSLIKNNADDTYTLSKERIRARIKEFLNLSTNDFRITPEQILYTANRLASKEIPITLRSNINYEVGFGAVDSITVVPSLLKIIGPRRDIDSIERLYTQKIVLENVMMDVSQNVSIDVSDLAKGVTVVPETVKVSQSVEKFTEGSVVVPVTLNNSDGRTIQLFPKEVTLFYAVPISTYDDVKVSDFTVEAITASDNNNESHLALAVTKKPAIVSQTRLSQNQVQYIIVDE